MFSVNPFAGLPVDFLKARREQNYSIFPVYPVKK